MGSKGLIAFCEASCVLYVCTSYFTINNNTNVLTWYPKFFFHMNSVGSFAIILECWKAEPEKRPDFSQIVVPISLTLEAAAGYMNFSMAVKNGQADAAKVEATTRAGGPSVQPPSEKEEARQQETAITNQS